MLLLLLMVRLFFLLILGLSSRDFDVNLAPVELDAVFGLDGPLRFRLRLKLIENSFIGDLLEFLTSSQ